MELSFSCSLYIGIVYFSFSSESIAYLARKLVKGIEGRVGESTRYDVDQKLRGYSLYTWYTSHPRDLLCLWA